MLGKEQQEDEGDALDPKGALITFNKHRFRVLISSIQASSSGVGGSGPILSFSGDTEDIEDTAVDLFAQEEAEEADGDDEEGDGAEPEDDFNAAWEVLDLARAIYDKQKDDDEEIKLKLADTYITLGDISLETGMFCSLYCYFPIVESILWYRKI